MRAQLIPLEGGSPITLHKDLNVVGRKDDCDIRLDHKSVSKLHCVLVRTDGLLMLRDLGSTNGTRVNGTRVRRAALLPNDQLTVANYKFRVVLGPDEPPAPLPPPRSEHTQQLDARDVADLLGRGPKVKVDDKNDDDDGGGAVRPNVLPDVYDDDAAP